MNNNLSITSRIFIPGKLPVVELEKLRDTTIPFDIHSSTSTSNPPSLVNRVAPHANSNMDVVPFHELTAKNTYQLVDYFHNHKDSVLSALPTLFDFYIKGLISKKILIDILSIRYGANKQSMISHPGIFKICVSHLIEMEKKDPTLAHSIFMIRDAGKDSPLHQPVNFAEAVPFLTLKSNSDPESVKAMLTMFNRKGQTPIHNALNFSNALPIFENLVKNSQSIREVLCAINPTQSKSIDDYSSEEDNDFLPPKRVQRSPSPNVTPLHSDENFQSALPLLTALKTANPYALCNILSCQNSSGETPLHHSGRFQRALPLIKALTVNNLSLLPLSVCNNDGQSVLHKPGNFKTLLPFLFDLVETNFIQVKSIMMLKDQKNLPALHIHENFKTAWPFLEQMAKKNFEEFMELMTDDDGCSPLIDVENLSVAMPFLVQLARNHQTRELKSLLTIEGIRGLTLLHYSDNFEITLPLLEELLPIDPDLVIFLLSRHDNNQETPLHNSVIFSDAVRNQTKDKIGVKLRFLFREIFRKNPSLLKTLWTLRNAVQKTPLHNPVNFKIAIPILLACAQTSPDLTIEILSCQDEKGICRF